MNPMKSNALCAMKICARFIKLLRQYLKLKVSTLPIIKNSTRLTSRTYSNVVGAYDTLRARAPKGLRASLKGVACLVALAIGISISIAAPLDSKAIIMPTKSVSQTANYLLTDKQYSCFRKLAFRESSWNGSDASPSFKAKNGSHYGFMQGKSKYLKTASPHAQLEWSMRYVANRYGITVYDEPNYCLALRHSYMKGWS
jgi:hypothetical protein